MSVYHLFFISEKQTFNVDGTDYDAWVISAGGETYYFMEPGDLRPEGYTIRDINALLASQGVNDMLYYVTRNPIVAVTATLADEYAGGSNTTTAAAYVDFTCRSFLQVGVHSGFPAGAAAKIVLPVRWKTAGKWTDGSLADWITAGTPTDSAHINIGLQILGIK